MDLLDQIDAAVTVCDKNLVIIYINDKAAATFADEGGASLKGKNLAACHKSTSIKKIHQILESQKPNVYTIEKNGLRKMIWQAPWRQDGEVAGIIEISMAIPADMPHHVRS
ncbi:MAG: hypothetical protein LLF89_10285 [Spirochaetaceae bacterium]|nr:hypothetical protein [Spirochaetaceae bacterium]